MHFVKKTVKQKKIFEEILNSYKDSKSEINNLKELFNLATEEKNEERKHKTVSCFICLGCKKPKKSCK